MPVSLQLAPVRESDGIPGRLGGRRMAQEATSEGKGGSGQKGSAWAVSAFSLLSKQIGKPAQPPPGSVWLLLLAAYVCSRGIQAQSNLNTVLKPKVCVFWIIPRPAPAVG